MKKICTKCGRPKILKHWGDWDCQNCRNEYFRNYRNRNLERKREIERKSARRNYDSKRNSEMHTKRMRWCLSGDVTREQLIELFEAHNGCCHYCGIRIPRPRFSPLTPKGFDHKASMSRGGKHTISNIVPCCVNCNNKKNRMSYRAFRRNLAALDEVRDE